MLLFQTGCVYSPVACAGPDWKQTLRLLLLAHICVLHPFKPSLQPCRFCPMPVLAPCWTTCSVLTRSGSCAHLAIVDFYKTVINCVQYGWPQKHSVRSNISLNLWPNIWPYYCIRSVLKYSNDVLFRNGQVVLPEVLQLLKNSWPNQALLRFCGRLAGGLVLAYTLRPEANVALVLCALCTTSHTVLPNQCPPQNLPYSS